MGFSVAKKKKEVMPIETVRIAIPTTEAVIGLVTLIRWP